MLQNLKTFISDISNSIKITVQEYPIPAAGVCAMLAVLSAILFTNLFMPNNDPGRSAIMIMTPQMNSGGTGVILKSSETESIILTNDHVCRVVKNGGVVAYQGSVMQIASYLEAKQSDLCLIKVNDDLGVSTKIASRGPRTYDKVSVSGFPALMPNIITEGHISGRAIIQVVTESRPCTEAEIQGPDGLACIILGGMVVVKNYESVLVSATIMHGSSGSGVYNSSKELEGLVFAGSGQIGYGWTVPYEQMINFLTKEAPAGQFSPAKNEVSLQEKSQGGRLKDIKDRCNKTRKHNEVLDQICRAVDRDLTWIN